MLWVEQWDLHDRTEGPGALSLLPLRSCVEQPYGAVPREGVGQSRAFQTRLRGSVDNAQAKDTLLLVFGSTDRLRFAERAFRPLLRTTALLSLESPFTYRELNDVIDLLG